ncbi:MAG: sugar-binding transcriptional regulator [Candidatus Humimicrobiaceae bacterium]
MREEEFIAKVAHMYYKQDMDLREIGKIFNVSYATISRLLKKGRETGIIKVFIDNPSNKLYDLELEIKNTFKIREIFAVNVQKTDSNELIKNIVAIQAAEYLENILKDGDILGISWGSTIYSVVNNFKGKKKTNVDIIQLNGNFATIPIEFNSSDLVRRIKDMFVGSYYFINSDTIADNKEIKEILMNSSSIKKTFLLHKSINIALLWIGYFNDRSISNLYKDYLRDEEIKELENFNVVGECHHIFFDINGKIFDSKIKERAISISKEDLFNINNKIVVATGLDKTLAIIGAMRAKIVDTLFIDSLTLENISKKI